MRQAALDPPGADSLRHGPCVVTFSAWHEVTHDSLPLPPLPCSARFVSWMSICAGAFCMRCIQPACSTLMNGTAAPCKASISTRSLQRDAARAAPTVGDDLRAMPGDGARTPALQTGAIHAPAATDRAVARSAAPGPPVRRGTRGRGGFAESLRPRPTSRVSAVSAPASRGRSADRRPPAWSGCGCPSAARLPSPSGWGGRR
jgi:hypothetical protein